MTKKKAWGAVEQKTKGEIVRMPDSEKLTLKYFEDLNKKPDDVVQVIVIASTIDRVGFDSKSILDECDMCPSVVWVRPESVERIANGATLLCVPCAKRVRSITPDEKWQNRTPKSVGPAALDFAGINNDPRFG